MEFRLGTAGLRPGRCRGHSGRFGIRGLVPRRHRGDSIFFRLRATTFYLAASPPT
jgi:hypothetical protein